MKHCQTTRHWWRLRKCRRRNDRSDMCWRKPIKLRHVGKSRLAGVLDCNFSTKLLVTSGVPSGRIYNVPSSQTPNQNRASSLHVCKTKGNRKKFTLEICNFFLMNHVSILFNMFVFSPTLENSRVSDVFARCCFLQACWHVLLYFDYLRVKLNEDQVQIVNFALEGHNLLITGQAGVGKSEVIKAFIGKAKEAGKEISVVCSRGISCQVYDCD